MSVKLALVMATASWLVKETVYVVESPTVSAVEPTLLLTTGGRKVDGSMTVKLAEAAPNTVPPLVNKGLPAAIVLLKEPALVAVKPML